MQCALKRIITNSFVARILNIKWLVENIKENVVATSEWIRNSKIIKSEKWAESDIVGIGYKYAAKA